MGAMADAFVAYARPLIDETDGSLEQVQKAFLLSQLCYNLALTPEATWDESLKHFQSSLGWSDEELVEFRETLILPMIARHVEMFPLLHNRRSSSPFLSDSFSPPPLPPSSPAPKPAPVDRYAPCPCNSGEKYKFCCGKKGR